MDMSRLLILRAILCSQNAGRRVAPGDGEATPALAIGGAGVRRPMPSATRHAA